MINCLSIPIENEHSNVMQDALDLVNSASRMIKSANFSEDYTSFLHDVVTILRKKHVKMLTESTMERFSHFEIDMSDDNAVIYEIIHCCLSYRAIVFGNMTEIERRVFGELITIVYIMKEWKPELFEEYDQNTQA